MALPRWQHHKPCLGYYYYYYHFILRHWHDELMACFSRAWLPELTLTSGAWESDVAVCTVTGMLSQELCHAVVSGAADSPRVHETSACLYQLCHQEWHPPVRCVTPQTVDYYFCYLPAPVFCVTRLGPQWFARTLGAFRRRFLYKAHVPPVPS